MGKVKKQACKLKNEKASKPKSKQKRGKSKIKVEKQFPLVPRMRLEPHLTPKKKEDTKNSIVDIEKDKRLIVSLNANEVHEYSENFTLQEALSYCNSLDNDEQRSEISDPLNISSAEKHIICETDMDDSQSSAQSQQKSVFRNIAEKKRRFPLYSRGMWWNDREIKALAIGLQSVGFADMKKVADLVKTKNENDIRVYMRPRCIDATKEKRNPDSPKRRGRPGNRYYTVSEEDLKSWPNIRKWRRLAYEQMLMYTRTKDYSKPVISSLCKRFYEEAEEPADPQVINVKLIYKYLMDCMSGQIPPQLPPKESALVLDMLREVRLMPIAYDFEEERKFIQEFRTATTFKPFEIKDEFKKRYRKAPVSEVCNPNVVSVPEEVFLDLSRHKRLVQSFNPLVTPVWMLQKEQEYLEKYSEESNVYVD